MLKILDRYIILKFMGTFFFVVLIFSLFAVVIDFSQNVEEFIDEKLSAGHVAKDYYLNFVIFHKWAFVATVCHDLGHFFYVEDGL